MAHASALVPFGGCDGPEGSKSESRSWGVGNKKVERNARGYNDPRKKSAVCSLTVP
jgi:hypothetical protein